MHSGSIEKLIHWRRYRIQVALEETERAPLQPTAKRRRNRIVPNLNNRYAHTLGLTSSKPFQGSFSAVCIATYSYDSESRCILHQNTTLREGVSFARVVISLQ